jgi:GMP synthase (glutamine-hydrolysing)
MEKQKKNIDEFIKNKVAELKTQLDGKKVLLGFSGGVDSAVTAALIHKASPDSLICVFIDHGLMRKHEPEQIDETFRKGLKMNIVMVDAAQRFLDKLSGVSDPEKKRKIIGEQFIREFEMEAKKIGKVDFLAQGTIYPDIAESGAEGSKLVKSHHNVGGLPDVIDFDGLVEPLRTLYKDEVREVGLALGLPHEVVFRQPFPGPGLGVRIIGDITHDKIKLLQDADHIYREEIALAGWEQKIWQYFAVLTGVRSTGKRNEERAYGDTIALRAVNSVDCTEADWTEIPLSLLAKISKRITTELPSVNRVVYDITAKPPATIEWE